ncbi:MAG: hypothetical protein WCJ51_02405 [Candidatus Moraniibacteriota bacterium]
MLDDIGLGNFLANITYLTLAFVTIVGVFFLQKNKKDFTNIWISLMLNLIFFLYFLGTPFYYISVVTIVIWPLFNIFIIIKLLKKYV